MSCHRRQPTLKHGLCRPTALEDIEVNLVASVLPPSRVPLSEQQLRELAVNIEIPNSVLTLGRQFSQAGYQLHLVGGSVRDALLGRAGSDIDLCTDARPEAVLGLLEGWAQRTWTTGIEFGTVGAARAGLVVEITTFRADRYDRISRSPEVVYASSLEEDLIRRDFTVNAMALSLPERVFSDPHGGLGDLVNQQLRTPGAAADSFADDPLRMLRTARFVAQLEFSVTEDIIDAASVAADQITRMSAERVRDEFSKLLCGKDPVAGLRLLVHTGLAEFMLPELPGMQLAIDEHHQHKDVYEHSLTVLSQAIEAEDPASPEGSPDLVLRLAALLHDIGKPATRRHEPRGGVSFHHHEVVGAKLTRKRLRAMRYPKEIIEAVSQLVFLHLRFHGFGRGEWTDSAVRRYVTDAGPLLSRLHTLVRSDCTTRNRRRAAILSATYDELEARITAIQAQEDLARIRPDLDGNEIMRLLGIGPGPLVGQAWQHLKELRLTHGPLDRERAEAELRSWAVSRGIELPSHE
ncbi:MAG: CCA tRNA nucleotidyltransferase [Mycobacteriales bacterium]